MKRASVVLVALVATAHADPAAEKLFQDGKQLVDSGKLDEGCDLIQRSQDLEPRVGTALNLGDCRAKQNRIALAWEAFVAAKAIATRLGDARGAEADKRAAELKPRLAYLTVKLPPPDKRIAGTVVSRDGVPMAPALYDQSVPVDPTTHTIEATAPGYMPWRSSVALVAGASMVVDVPASLVVAPSARKDTGGSKISPALRKGALGIAFGSTSDGDIAYGLRGIVGFPITGGALRFNFTVLYAYVSNDPMDADNNTHLFAPGGAIEYFAAYRPGLALSAGVGFGVDISNAFYDSETKTQAWVAPRVSPIIFRLSNPRLEVGLHLSFVTPQNVLVGVVGLDWFL